MSKYTTELRYYLGTLAGTEDTENVQEILSNTWDKVFDFYFPIYDEEHKETLCKKILLHYYFREIGMETVGAWKVKLEMLMNEIMPFYNKLYQALDDEFKVKYSRDEYIEREYQGKDDFTSENQGTSENTVNFSSDDENTSKFLDTPQGGLDGIVDNDYLTNVTINTTENSQTTKNSGSNTANSTNKNVREHTETEHRYGGDNIFENIEKYNQELFNIDLRIIKALNPLFFKLW